MFEGIDLYNMAGFVFIELSIIQTPIFRLLTRSEKVQTNLCSAGSTSMGT